MPTKLTHEMLRYMNIGERFWSARRADLTERQLKSVGPYLSKIETAIRDGVGIFLWGDNSVGKSYVAAVLCKYVWAEFRVASYCLTANELKEAWIHDPKVSEESEETVLGRSESVRFLVIDDLGREHRAKSGFAEGRFNALLRHRSRTKRVTCITTNLSLQGFKEVYGKPSLELAQECMMFVKVDDESHRRVLHEELSRQYGLVERKGPSGKEQKKNR
jgi:DNA replication protein DnaC